MTIEPDMTRANAAAWRGVLISPGDHRQRRSPGKWPALEDGGQEPSSCWSVVLPAGRPKTRPQRPAVVHAELITRFAGDIRGIEGKAVVVRT
jgi:hypothetical protein